MSSAQDPHRGPGPSGACAQHTVGNDIWIAVDYGGVLTNPIAETVSRFCALHQLSPQTLLSAMHNAGTGTDTGMALLERGDITEEQFLSRINGHLFPDAEDRITVEEFHRTWFAGRTANTDMLDGLRDLSARGVRLALITNNVAEWREYWHDTLGEYINLFEVIIDSSAAGTRKPESQIYRLLLDATDLDPHRSLFIDDDSDNIDAGEAFGLHAHLFTDTPTALATCRAFLTQVGA